MHLSFYKRPEAWNCMYLFHVYTLRLGQCLEQSRHTNICEWVSEYLLFFLFLFYYLFPFSPFLLVLYFKILWTHLWKLLLGSTDSNVHCSVAVSGLPFSSFCQVLIEMSTLLFFSYFHILNGCQQVLEAVSFSLHHLSLPSIAARFLSPIPGNIQRKYFHMSHKSLR